MAVGLIIGVDAEPTQEQFEELLDKGVIEPEGFTFEALSVSTAEAADRAHLRELFMAACAKQDWLEGTAFADDLEFADLLVHGGRLVVVKPPVAPPEAAGGGIIAGIGFTPSQADLQALAGQFELQPDRQYVLSSFTEDEAEHDEYPIAAYVGTAKRKGWPSAALDGVSVTRRAVDGKRYLLIAPHAGDVRPDIAEPPAPSPPRAASAADLRRAEQRLHDAEEQLQRVEREQRQSSARPEPASGDSVAKPSMGSMWWVGLGLLPVGLLMLLEPVVGAALTTGAIVLMVVSYRRRQPGAPVPARAALLFGTLLASFGVAIPLLILVAVLADRFDAGEYPWAAGTLVCGGSLVVGAGLLLWRRSRLPAGGPGSRRTTTPGAPASDSAAGDGAVTDDAAGTGAATAGTTVDTVADVMDLQRRGDTAGLLRALRHTDIAVRAEAVSALGALGDSTAVESLIATLRGDDDPYVRSLAAESLGGLGDARARDALLAAIQDDTMEVAAAATDALMQVK